MCKKVYTIKLISILMSLILVAVMVTSCSAKDSQTSNDKSQTSSAPAKTEAPKNVTLRWLGQAGSSTEADQWRELAGDVTKKYPNITVQLESTDWNSYWTKLPTEMASGSPPDIFYMQVLRTKGYVSKGFLPLDDLIAKDKDIDIKDFYKGVLDGLSDGGKLYALPYDFGPYVLFYNIDLFDKYGVPYPDDNLDYQGFLDRARKLTKDGNYGTVISANWDRVLPFMWGEGADLFPGGKFNVNQSAIAKAVQRHAELITKEKVAPAITDTGNFNWDREQFYSGKIGMMLDGPWNITNIKAKGKFKFGASLVPKGTVTRLSPVNGSGFGISAKTKNPNEAFLAIKSLTSKESLEKLAKWGRALPARESVRQAFYDSNKDVAGVDNAVKKSCDPAIGKPYLTPDKWQEVYTTINQNIEPVFLNKDTAENGLKKAQQLIDDILK